MKDIVFPAVQLAGIIHKIGDVGFTTRLRFTGKFTESTATSLGARWLAFDREAVPRDFGGVDLRAEIPNVRFSLIPAKVVTQSENVTFRGSAAVVNRFKVQMSGGRRKAKAPALRMLFSLEYLGDTADLMAWVKQWMRAECRMKLEAIQGDLFVQQGEPEPTPKAAKPKKARKAASATDGQTAEIGQTELPNG